MDKQTIENYNIIEKLVDTKFPLIAESKERFKKNLYDPQIDPIYSEMIGEDLRTSVPLSLEDVESFDKGWQYFQRSFRHAVSCFSISYMDFIRGTVMKGKQLVKISRFNIIYLHFLCYFYVIFILFLNIKKR